jgi:phosphatidylserine/phosphatidylglycerophosphate/cardiolipin synthase-like enzyme
LTVDRFVIVGSANLNDRSQLGDRDSEVAVVIEDPPVRQAYMNGQPVLSPFNTIPNENSGMWLRLLLLFVADFVANILAFFTQMNLTTSLQTVILFPPEMNMTGIARKISWLRTP